MAPDRQRRRFLKTAGLAGIAGFAGCSGDGGDGADGGDTPADTETGTETEAEDTAEPTETETETETGSTERTIRMGLLMGVSGQLSSLGPPIRRGAELAVAQVRDADSRFGVDTQFEDTGTEANQGISGAEALVNAGYPVICGALASPVTIQVAKNVTVPNGVPICSPASTSPEISTLEDNDFVFRTPPTDGLQGAALAQVAAERLDATTASTFFLNQAYGQGVDQGFTSAFRDERGGEVLNRVSFESGQSSYTSQLRQALSDDPDTMVIVGYPESGVQIFRDFYSEFDRGDMPLLVTDGLQDGSLPGKVGRDMGNVSGTAPLASGPGNEFFQQSYQEAYDEEVSVSFTGYAYDAAAVLMLAGAAAGEDDGAAIQAEMRNVANPGGTEVTPENLVEGLEMAADGEEIDYRGATSAVEFDDVGDLRAATYEYYQFTDDGLETVDEIQFSK